jgi:hypothetical protein
MPVRGRRGQRPGARNARLRGRITPRRASRASHGLRRRPGAAATSEVVIHHRPPAAGRPGAPGTLRNSPGTSRPGCPERAPARPGGTWPPDPERVGGRGETLNGHSGTDSRARREPTSGYLACPAFAYFQEYQWKSDHTIGTRAPGAPGRPRAGGYRRSLHPDRSGHALCGYQVRARDAHRRRRRGPAHLGHVQAVRRPRPPVTAATGSARRGTARRYPPSGGRRRAS